MKKEQEERLFFYSKSPEDLEKTLGKKMPINPYNLIQQHNNHLPSNDAE